MANTNGQPSIRVLDLFCGAGGSARGYAMPGVEIVGVDIAPQPRYPYEFVRADATEYPLDGFDAIHASPPCKGHTGMRWADGDTRWMLRHTLDRLAESSARLWVVENVMSAYNNRPCIRVCGSGLGCVAHGSRLFLSRHRKFWCNVEIKEPPCNCGWYRKHGYRVAGIYGHGPNGSRYANEAIVNTAMRRRIMGIDWMLRDELSDAIPPAYTRYLMHEAVRQGVFNACA